MRTTVLLADSAQTDLQGKVHALGLGWSVTTSPTPPAAIVTLVEVDWNEANQKYKIEFDLVDEDGHPVELANPFGEPEKLHFEAEFEMGRPPGIPPGTPLVMPFTVPIGPGLPLQPNRSYRWKVTNSGQPGDDLGLSFYVRSAPTA